MPAGDLYVIRRMTAARELGYRSRHSATHGAHGAGGLTDVKSSHRRSFGYAHICSRDSSKPRTPRPFWMEPAATQIVPLPPVGDVDGRDRPRSGSALRGGLR